MSLLIVKKWQPPNIMNSGLLCVSELESNTQKNAKPEALTSSSQGWRHKIPKRLSHAHGPCGPQAWLPRLSPTRPPCARGFGSPAATGCSPRRHHPPTCHGIAPPVRQQHHWPSSPITAISSAPMDLPGTNLPRLRFVQGA